VDADLHTAQGAFLLQHAIEHVGNCRSNVAKYYVTERRLRAEHGTLLCVQCVASFLSSKLRQVLGRSITGVGRQTIYAIIQQHVRVKGEFERFGLVGKQQAKAIDVCFSFFWLHNLLLPRTASAMFVPVIG
jgi:hypothetical protein